LTEAEEEAREIVNALSRKGGQMTVVSACQAILRNLAKLAPHYRPITEKSRKTSQRRLSWR
jgi:hypothetical protein